jgi:hypothetical protein
MEKYHYTGGGANRTVEEVEKLQKKYETFDTKYIHEIFNKVLGLKVKEIQKPMNVGLPHVTYIVSFENHEDLVYRGNLGWDEPEMQLLKEKLIAEEALKAEIPSNEIIYVDISRKEFPFDFQIQKKIQGLDAEKEWNGTQADYDKYSFNLGKIIGKLRKVNLKNFGHFNEEIMLKGDLVGEMDTFSDYINLQLHDQIDLIEKSNFISNSTATAIKKLFQDSTDLFNDSNSSLIHYDLADHNLRYDPKTFEVVAVYDWEASVTGDSLLDIASCPTWKALYPKLEKVKEGFVSIAGKPDNFEEKLNLYRLRTIIWKVEHNIKFGIATPERVQRLALALEPFQLKMS